MKARLVIVLTVALIALPADSHAAPTWLAPVPLAPASFDAFFFTNGQTDVAVAPDGTVIAVWLAERGGTYRVEHSVRPPGGVFGVATPLSAAEHDAREPRLAIDGSGNAIVAWTVTAPSVVQYSSRPAGGAFSAPAPLSDPTDSAEHPAIAMSRDGDALAAYSEAGVVNVRSRPAGGSFGTPQPIVDGAGDADVYAALNDAGAAAVVWKASDRIKATVRPIATDAFGAAQFLSAAAGVAASGRVAIDDQGNATAVWVRRNIPGQDIVQSATRPSNLPGFALPAQDEVSAPGQSASHARVAVDSEGTAVAVWQRSNGANTIVQAAIRPAGSSFGDRRDLSAAGQNSAFPDVRMDGQNNAIAIWSTLAPTGSAAQSASKPPGGLFGAVRQVSEPGANVSFPRIATDPAGNAAAVWSSFDDLFINITVKAAGYDGAAPTLSDVSVPERGASGDPLAFSASTADVWSAVTVEWDFGDGANATGPAVNHTYANTGTYTVTLTARDAVGNATTDTRTIQIVLPDRDGDGFATAQDCNDGNAAIKPGATDVPDNGVDEDCSGADAINLDRDGDGATRPQDCNDANPGIRPGARDVPRNGIDEDCAGGDEPYPVITSPIENRWAAGTRTTRVTRLRVRAVPKGGKVELRCTPPKRGSKRLRSRACQIKRRTFTADRRGTVDLVKRLRRPIPVGTVLELRVTAPAMIGKVVRFTVRRRKVPSSAPLCLAPGATKPAKRC